MLSIEEQRELKLFDSGSEAKIPGFSYKKREPLIYLPGFFFFNPRGISKSVLSISLMENRKWLSTEQKWLPFGGFHLILPLSGVETQFNAHLAIKSKQLCKCEMIALLQAQTLYIVW